MIQVHAFISLRADIISGNLEGFVEYTLDGHIPDVINLHFDGKEIGEVSLNNYPLKFTYQHVQMSSPSERPSSDDSRTGSMFEVPDLPSTIAEFLPPYTRASSTLLRGNVTVHIPRALVDKISQGGQLLTLRVNYFVCSPASALFFTEPVHCMVIPPGPLSCSSWVPSIENCSALMAYTLSVSVQRELTCVAPGALLDKSIDSSSGLITFVFQVDTPLPFRRISFCIGDFSIAPHPDFDRQEAILFFPRDGNVNLPDVQATTSCLRQIVDLIDSHFEIDFRTVFMRQLNVVFVPWMPLESYSTFNTIFLRMDIIHNSTAIDPVRYCREILVNAIVESYVTSLLIAKDWGDIWIEQGISGFISDLILQDILSTDDVRNIRFERRTRVFQDEEEAAGLRASCSNPPYRLSSFSTMSVETIPSNRAVPIDSSIPSSSRLSVPVAALEEDDYLPGPLVPLSFDMNDTIDDIFFIHPSELMLPHRFRRAVVVFCLLDTHYQKRVRDSMIKLIRLEVARGVKNRMSFVERIVDTTGFKSLLVSKDPSFSDLFDIFVFGRSIPKVHVGIDFIARDNNLRFAFRVVNPEEFVRIRAKIPITVRICEDVKTTETVFYLDREYRVFDFECAGRPRVSLKDTPRLCESENNTSIKFIHIFPDLEGLVRVRLFQPASMWVSMLESDTGFYAQMEALRNLSRCGHYEGVADALERVIESPYTSIPIRSQCLNVYRNVIESGIRSGSMFVVSYFERLFCEEPGGKMLSNDFSELSSYYLKKDLIRCLGELVLSTPVSDRAAMNNSSMRIILRALRENSNDQNPLSDEYYIAELFRSLALMYPTADDMEEILEVCRRYLRKEDLRTSHNGIIASSIFACLACLCSSCGRFESRDEIIRRLWDRFRSDKNYFVVETCMLGLLHIYGTDSIQNPNPQQVNTRISGENGIVKALESIIETIKQFWLLPSPIFTDDTTPSSYDEEKSMKILNIDYFPENESQFFSFCFASRLLCRLRDVIMWDRKMIYMWNLSNIDESSSSKSMKIELFPDIHNPERSLFPFSHDRIASCLRYVDKISLNFLSAFWHDMISLQVTSFYRRWSALSTFYSLFGLTELGSQKQRSSRLKKALVYAERIHTLPGSDEPQFKRQKTSETFPFQNSGKELLASAMPMDVDQIGAHTSETLSHLNPPSSLRGPLSSSMPKTAQEIFASLEHPYVAPPVNDSLSERLFATISNRYSALNSKPELPLASESGLKPGGAVISLPPPSVTTYRGAISSSPLFDFQLAKDSLAPPSLPPRPPSSFGTSSVGIPNADEFSIPGAMEHFVSDGVSQQTPSSIIRRRSGIAFGPDHVGESFSFVSGVATESTSSSVVSLEQSSSNPPLNVSLPPPGAGKKGVRPKNRSVKSESRDKKRDVTVNDGVKQGQNVPKFLSVHKKGVRGNHIVNLFLDSSQHVCFSLFSHEHVDAVEEVLRELPLSACCYETSGILLLYGLNGSEELKTVYTKGQLRREGDAGTVALWLAEGPNWHLCINTQRSSFSGSKSKKPAFGGECLFIGSIITPGISRLREQFPAYSPFRLEVAHRIRIRLLESHTLSSTSASSLAGAVSSSQSSSTEERGRSTESSTFFSSASSPSESVIDLTVNLYPSPLTDRLYEQPLATEVVTNQGLLWFSLVDTTCLQLAEDPMFWKLPSVKHVEFGEVVYWPGGNAIVVGFGQTMYGKPCPPSKCGLAESCYIIGRFDNMEIAPEKFGCVHTGARVEVDPLERFGGLWWFPELLPEVESSLSCKSPLSKTSTVSMETAPNTESSTACPESDSDIAHSQSSTATDEVKESSTALLQNGLDDSSITPVSLNSMSAPSPPKPSTSDTSVERRFSQENLFWEAFDSSAGREFLDFLTAQTGEVHFEMHHDEDDTSMLFELIPIECPRFCLSEDFYNPSSRSYSFVEMDSCRRSLLPGELGYAVREKCLCICVPTVSVLDSSSDIVWNTGRSDKYQRFVAIGRLSMPSWKVFHQFAKRDRVLAINVVVTGLASDSTFSSAPRTVFSSEPVSSGDGDQISHQEDRAEEDIHQQGEGGEKEEEDVSEFQEETKIPAPSIGMDDSPHGGLSPTQESVSSSGFAEVEIDD